VLPAVPLLKYMAIKDLVDFRVFFLNRDFSLSLMLPEGAANLKNAIIARNVANFI
jgi:hypothetical protein